MNSARVCSSLSVAVLRTIRSTDGDWAASRWRIPVLAVLCKGGVGMVRRRLWALVVLVLACAPSVYAQTVAQLSGTVVDESSGALPGVEVTATQTNTGASRFV